MGIKLNEEELVVCRILYSALHNKNGICDLADFSEKDEEILLDFEKKGYMRSDANCLILFREFKEFLEKLFEGELK